MELADRIEALWNLLRAASPEGDRARRRAAATSAMGIFFAVLLVLVGLRDVVVVLASAVLALVVVAVAVLLVRRGTALAERLARVRAATSRVVSWLHRRSGHAGAKARAGVEARLPTYRDRSARAVSSVITRTTRAGASARAGVESHLPTYRDRYSRAQAVAAEHLANASTHAQRHARSAATALATSAKEAWPTRTPVVRQREAVRANAAGVQLRRQGTYGDAAERHRFALEIFRELGDRRSEALTLNNLALALDRAGDAAALDLFEQAATILGELGEEEHEGKVIANLGLAFRRRGEEEQSAEVFELALGKLDPGSEAYRTVERLRRAS